MHTSLVAPLGCLALQALPTPASAPARPALQASIVPAACGLLLTPLLMYKLFPPEIKDTPEAPKVGGEWVCCACACAWVGGWWGWRPMPTAAGGACPPAGVHL